MKILFTKKLDEDEISTILGEEIHATFLEVISIHYRKVLPFSLIDNSLIFTSVHGVKAFFQNQFIPADELAERNFHKIYCVGKKTKLELRKHGFRVFKMKKNARELSEFIIDKCSKEKFIHFCGNLALDILQQNLPPQNIGYKKVILYDTELIYPIINEKYDAIAFFSPSGVQSFMKNNPLNFKKIFAIGETTGKEIEKHTTKKIFINKQNNLRNLLKSIKKEGEL